MREYDLNKLLTDKTLLDKRIDEFIKKEILFKQKVDSEEIKGHILKSEHNLRFVNENLKLGYLDWAITGCYYTCYHSALALIQTKGYTSKNHLATLCVLIKEFYQSKLSKEDMEFLSSLLDYQDILFYTETKNKREDATYSTKMRFDKKDTEQLRIKASLFVDKIKSIISNQN